jgi:hypothetical protein
MLPPDNPWPVVLVLLCVAVGFGFSWIGSRKTYALSVALIALGLASGIYAWSISVETPSKVIVKNLHDMVAAFKNHDVPKTMSYFSKQADVPVLLEELIKNVEVRGDIRITDVSVKFTQQNSLGTLHFRANGGFTYRGISVESYPTNWELDWQREGKEWKIVQIRRLHFMNGTPVDFQSKM